MVENKYDILSKYTRYKQVIDWCYRNLDREDIYKLRVIKTQFESNSRRYLKLFETQIFNKLLYGNGSGDNPQQLGTVLQYAIDYHGKRRIIKEIMKGLLGKVKIILGKGKKYKVKPKLKPKPIGKKFKYYGYIKGKKQKIGIELNQKTKQIQFRNKKGQYASPSQSLNKKLIKRGLIKNEKKNRK